MQRSCIFSLSGILMGFHISKKSNVRTSFLFFIAQRENIKKSLFSFGEKNCTLQLEIGRFKRPILQYELNLLERIALLPARPGSVYRCDASTMRLRFTILFIFYRSNEPRFCGTSTYWQLSHERQTCRIDFLEKSACLMSHKEHSL